MRDRDTSFLLICLVCVFLLIVAVGKYGEDDKPNGPEDCAPDERWTEVGYESGSGYLGTRSGSFGVCLPNLAEENRNS